MTDAKTEQHRALFPALANKAYFNYGGTGPLPSLALAAISQAYQFIQQAGPFSSAVNDWIDIEADRTRMAIASQLGVSKLSIALTEDVTVGCNIALWGIDWSAGDHILISDCEHPGIVAAVKELQRRFGIEISICSLVETLDRGDPVAAIVQHLRPSTRLVVISHILWNTGQVLPLAQIATACKNVSSARILVDAAQSVGVLPLNLGEIPIDFYAFTGHKWWCGPEGLGGLYISPDALESLNPTFIGWRGIVTDSSGNPIRWQSDARRYEVATSAYPLMAGLAEAIALHERWGSPQQRLQQIQHLSHYLWQRLSELPYINCLNTSPPAAGLVSFQVKGIPHNQFVKLLEQQNCFIRTIRFPDCVRACVHYFTFPSEIHLLLDVVDSVKSAL
ncbi:aminotransferase class V-fold PLP-dependent enzyme [Microseira wollei]|uniref:L-cysteine/cystine lyase n=1 Tax=Microseira wollei NIES-4236 TaxID=2530354 RepID=A0AAV3XDT6_9CYAN|nr:aminotransferase class V-fold PLP-dependent enzyme [Microseira wollei]GET39598.1 L-cysteine/cystine lyase [Microseira wollei NIES-4236]